LKVFFIDTEIFPISLFSTFNHTSLFVFVYLFKMEGKEDIEIGFLLRITS